MAVSLGEWPAEDAAIDAAVDPSPRGLPWTGSCPGSGGGGGSRGGGGSCRVVQGVAARPGAAGPCGAGVVGLTGAAAAAPAGIVAPPPPSHEGCVQASMGRCVCSSSGSAAENKPSEKLCRFTQDKCKNPNLKLCFAECKALILCTRTECGSTSVLVTCDSSSCRAGACSEFTSSNPMLQQPVFKSCEAARMHLVEKSGGKNL